jgi:phage-related protein
MAEENILNISLKEYKSQIESLKSSLLSLEKESDSYKQTVAKVQQMQDKLNDILLDCKNNNVAVKGSYNALTAELSSLRKQWKATADEVERDNIGAKMLDINNQLKALDSTVGNYQRNVGDYANQFSSAFSSLGGSISGTFEKIKSMTSSLPELSNAFVSAGKGLKSMATANPILFAISTAITAIVAICDKFKQAVSKNADLQKRWNANLAAFQPILEIIDKLFNKLAETVMDLVDWCVDHIPAAVKVINKYIGFVIDTDKLLINAVLFLPKTFNTAFAQCIKIIGTATNKIGTAMSGIMTFFGADEMANKVKATMSNISGSITSFGDSYLNSINTVSNSINSFFDGVKNRITEYTSKGAELVASAKKNAKEQQRLAKETVQFEEKAAATEKQMIEDRIALKKAKTEEEKKLIRSRIAAANEELANEKKALAVRKYLLKQQEYTRNGRVLSGAEKKELNELRLSAFTAGNEYLQRNIKITSAESTSTGKALGTKLAKATSEAFTTELAKALANIKGDELSKYFTDYIDKLTAGNKLRETAAKNISDYLTIDKGIIKSKLTGAGKMIEQQLKVITLDILNDTGKFANQNADEVFDQLMDTSKFGLGSYSISNYFKNLVSVLKKAGVSDELISSYNIIFKSTFDYFKDDVVGKYNEELPSLMLQTLETMKFDSEDVNNVIKSNKRDLQAVIDASTSIQNVIGATKLNDYSGVYQLLSGAFGFKDKSGATKAFANLTDDELNIVKETYNNKFPQLLEQFQSKLITLISQVATSVDSAIKKDVSDSVSKFKGELTDALKELNSKFANDTAYKNATVFNDLFNNSDMTNKVKGYVNLLNDYNKSVEDTQDDSKIELLKQDVDLYNEKIDSLVAEREQMIANGATELELAEMSKEIDEAKLQRQQTMSDLSTEQYNLEIKEINNTIKKRQNWVKNIQTAYSNVGSAISSVASIRQESIQDQLDAGKISEEEAQAQWESTQKMAIAAATIETLGAAIGQTYTIWTDHSIVSYWAKAALIASTVPATVASLVAQINQIKSTSPSTSSSVSSSSGASISSVAVTPILDENQDVNTIQQIKSGNTGDLIRDQRVYIVESDIQKSNKRVAVRESNSTF